MFKNGGGVGGTESLTADGQLHEWFHIVGTYNGQSLNQSFSGTMTSDGPIRRKLYVNGNMLDSDRESFFGGNIGDSYIGSYHANGLERAPMELAVARIYNRELSHEEIKQNYNAQKSRIDAIPKIAKPASLVLYLDAGMFESYKGSGSGTTIYDLSGNGNDGTINGATYPANTVLAENDMGRYFDFDGTDDNISVGDAGTLDITGDMTLSCWVALGSSENSNLCMLVNKRDSSDYTAPYSLFFEDRSGQNKFGVLLGGGGSDYVVVGSNDNFDGVYDKWDYVCFTISGTTISLYVNGVFDASGTFTGSRQTNNVALKIGGPYTDGSSNYMMDGKIANVMVYNGVALSANQVMQNYNYFKHRFGK